MSDDQQQQEVIDYFRFQCEKGFLSRGLDKKQNTKEYRDRLEYEIEVVVRMGFAGYFLIVQDFINWARGNDIPVGPGRGSIGGSLAAYCMNIHQVDPIKYHLIFERFLNPGRTGSAPDIDCDFSREHRDQVVEYVTNKYGQDRVCHIGTFGLMRAKNAVRNVARALGHPYEIGDKLSKLLLAPVHGKPQSLAISLKKVEELSEYYKKAGAFGEILKISEKFEDLVNSVGQHAAGVIIANEPIDKSIALYRARNEKPTAQWEMNNLEKLGYVKFDFLGLDTLTRIYYCLKFIKQRHNIDLDIDGIDREDPKVFENIRTGNLLGLFQIEGSAGLRDLVVQVQPTRLEDLSVIVASYRPGPLSSSGLQDYLKVRAGYKEAEYLLPELKPILSDTDGFLVYQEQALRIARDLAGYDLSEADNLRKAIGKKLDKEMAKHEDKFKRGCANNNLPSDKVNTLWSNIKAFADYSFNYAHALEYSLITYQTAYLKTHYPVEWMCAVMICDKDNTDQMVRYISECQRMGIKILPPDINKSSEVFSIDSHDNILFGLSPVKNLGEGPVNEILSNREKYGKFKSLYDFLTRSEGIKVNKLKVESLIKAGAFDFTGYTRNSMLSALESYWEYKAAMKSYGSKMGTYRKKLTAVEQRLKDMDEGGVTPSGAKLKPLKDPIRPSKPTLPVIPRLSELSDKEILEQEHELLGYYVSYHPLDMYDVSELGCSTTEEAAEMYDNDPIILAGVVVGIKEITTKKKQQKMAFIVIEDKTGQIECVVFTRTFERMQRYIQKGNAVLVSGSLSVTEGDTEKVCKVRISKIVPLDNVAPRAQRSATKTRDYLLPADPEKLTKLLYLTSKPSDVTIENVTLRMKLQSGIEVVLPAVTVNKTVLEQLIS